MTDLTKLVLAMMETPEDEAPRMILADHLEDVIGNQQAIDYATKLRKIKQLKDEPIVLIYDLIEKFGSRYERRSISEYKRNRYKNHPFIKRGKHVNRQSVQKVLNTITLSFVLRLATFYNPKEVLANL